MTHLTEEELFTLAEVDAEDPLPPHVEACPTCRAALADVKDLLGALAPGDVDEAAHVASVLRAVDARVDAKPPRAPRFAAVAVALTLAAGVAFFVARPRANGASDEFAARGSSLEAGSYARVGVRLFSGERDPVPLANGSVVAPTTAFTAAYTNLGPGPMNVVVFAVDAADEVHWLYPAYERAGEDPSSVVLPPTTRERFLPSSVILERPALGTLRVVAMITDRSLHVSDIESRSGQRLARDVLERDFRASVSEVHLEVRSAP